MNLKKGIIILLALVLSLVSLTAKNVSYSNGRLSFETGNYKLSEVTIDGKTFTTIDYDNQTTLSRKGFAELPYLNASVVLENKNIELNITADDYQEIELAYPMLPSRGILYRNQDPATIPYETAQESLVDEFYPNMLAENSEPYILRDVRGSNIYVYPFQYNAKNNVLRIYKSIDVEIVENNSDVINPLPKTRAKKTLVMDNLYRTAFINYTTTRFDNELDQFGSILVLRPAEYADAIAPYVQWKREKGYTVYEVEASGNVTSLVEEQYNEHNDILYVQLVGDWDDISGPTSGGAATDPNLGLVVGNDVYPDLIVGRFSAQTATDVTTQVNKTINYEKTPEAGDWLSKGLGIGSEQGAGNGDDGEADYAHIDIIKENKLLPFTYTEVAEAYQYPSTGDVSGPVNNGLSVINYCGHGSKTSWVTSGFSNSNVNALSNGNKLPFIFSVACVNGDFQSGGDCFAEAWLKKSNGGAVGMFASTINQSWAPPMKGQDYMNDLLIGGYDYTNNPGNGINVEVHKTTYGAICFNGSILMTNEDPSGGPEMLETWTLFGDASLQVRTEEPSDLTLSNSTVLNGVDYTTTITMNGEPVEGAIVSLYQNDIAYFGISDATGNVTVAHELTPGTCTMTVTAFNAVTIYNEDCEVIPQDGPFVVVDNYEVNGSSAFGETFSFDIDFKNVGSADATGITATLSTEDEYITVTNSSLTVGDITANTIESFTESFNVEVANNAADGHTAEFIVTMTGNEATWTANLYVTLQGPVFEIGNMIIEDSGNNGLLDAGETATITIPVTNIGSVTSPDLEATLITATPNLITIDSAESNLAGLESNETGELTFEISVSEDAGEGSTAILAVAINAGAYTSNKTFYPSVGLVFEDFETGDFSSFDWEQGSMGWQISDDAQEGNHSMQNVDINDNQTASISITMDVAADGEISFWKKVSSENNYDYLRFYINGQSQGEWCGEAAWTEETFDVSAGEVTFEWKYEKDTSVSNGSDCGWIDMITFPGGGAMTEVPIFSVNTTEIDFGEIAPNETATETFTIYNLGNAELNGTIDVTEDFDISVSEYSLAIGENIDVTVSFTPEAAGEYTGSVAITSNDTNNPEATITLSGTGNGSGADDLIPMVTELQGNYPNPFNPTTTIRYALNTDEKVEIEIYNIKGQTVKTLVNEDQAAGYHSVVWNGKDNSNKQSASGIYFYKFKAGNIVSMKKMILLK